MTPIALRGMAANEVGRARISMMVRSMSSDTRPDTLVQDRRPSLIVFSCNARRVHTLGVRLGPLMMSAVRPLDPPKRTSLTLTDVMGKPFPGEQYKRKLGPADDEMVIARQPLRSKASD